MPRSPDPVKRRDLLDRIRDYLLQNGLADLSLRPLARALGTSDRMLLYYFGTKERMVAEALAVYERRPLLRTRDILKTVGSPTDPEGLRRFMEELWRQFSAPDVRATLPLYLEIMSAEVLHPDRYGPVMRDIITAWTDLLTSVFRDLGLDHDRAWTEATVLTDATFGLLMAPLAHGDWERAGLAFNVLLDRLEPGWDPMA
ncbi:AcrR family transcriptional regulator [Streptomyces griseochromogenes]|uniref:AcrR family transcriptional regulator n=1 Tax=Streptomyces griseochromogenes TaxID=68214 RepID=A0A1B1B0H1_9ACTN|nr:TetR/AcrR family transcriptional regulator [Streptomyces griseochromogenes]ANP52318.1 TetR family transcriptional regulator [Streptomyces griseochromogenes]MBP2055728.1 AcrR family transcriptional regulator [Streptomyces griseochromogenes]